MENKRIIEVLSTLEDIRVEGDLLKFIAYFKSLKDEEVFVMREFALASYKACEAELERRALEKTL